MSKAWTDLNDILFCQKLRTTSLMSWKEETQNKIQL
jgi:hypothetical protein